MVWQNKLSCWVGCVFWMNDSFGLYFSFHLWAAAFIMHCKNTHLLHFLPVFIQPFSLKQIASHRLSQLVIHCLALCSKPQTKAERWREEEGEGQSELEFGQSSNVFPGCLHGLIKSPPLAWTLVATRGGLWCLCHHFPPAYPSTQIPSSLSFRYHNIKHTCSWSLNREQMMLVMCFLKPIVLLCELLNYYRLRPALWWLFLCFYSYCKCFCFFFIFH